MGRREPPRGFPLACPTRRVTARAGGSVVSDHRGDVVSAGPQFVFDLLTLFPCSALPSPALLVGTRQVFVCEKVSKDRTSTRSRSLSLRGEERDFLRAFADSRDPSSTASERTKLEARVVFGLLLALGEFELSELPDEHREPIIEQLANWHAHDPAQPFTAPAAGSCAAGDRMRPVASATCACVRSRESRR